MNMAQAEVAAAEGAHIKRKLWDSWLRQWQDGKLRFVLPEKLRELGNDYTATPIERTSNDWEAKR